MVSYDEEKIRTLWVKDRVDFYLIYNDWINKEKFNKRQPHVDIAI